MYNENTWKTGEKIAQDYMKKNGFKIIETNFCVAGVELDIVATFSVKMQYKKLKIELKQKIKDEKNKSKIKLLKQNLKNYKKSLSNLLVITEVKARSSDKFGLGIEAVDLKKQRNIKRGANALFKQKKFENFQLRFDVASVDNEKITYFENVF